MIYQQLLVSDLPYFIDIGPTRNYPAHMHSEVELIYCVEGDISIIIEGETHHLKQHDLAFVEKLVPHEYMVGDGVRLAIEVGSLFLAEHYKKFSSISFNDPIIRLSDIPEGAENLKKLRSLIDEIVQEYQKTSQLYSSLNIKGNIYKICHIMLQEFAENSARPWHVTDDIHTVLDLIHNHYNEPLDVETVAQKINYGKSSFCFHFKKFTGKTFHTYLNHFRIKKASHMLTETASTVEAIAYSVGFNDPKTFSRVFKSVVGMSPREYRKQNSQK